MKRRDFVAMFPLAAVSSKVFARQPGAQPPARGTGTRVAGRVDSAFEGVRVAFMENFASRNELGGAVCVFKDGRKVVDLWGGWSDPQHTRHWQEDTIVCMMSVAKGVTALCAWRLIERGQLELDALVTDYWPEYGQNGKQHTTVKHILGHKAGVLSVDTLEAGKTSLDYDAYIAAIERQAPAYEPGAFGAYHALTYGHLVGELVRRVSGKKIDVFLRDELCGPIGIDYALGVVDSMLPRVADTVVNPIALPAESGMPPPAALQSFINSQGFRQGLLPSGNGHGNARALATLFSALAGDGTIHGVQVLSPATLRRAVVKQWELDWLLKRKLFSVALGFDLNDPQSLFAVGPNSRTFGAAGLGGHIVFADPDARLAFAYSPNRHGDFDRLGARCDALVAATYSSI